MNWYEFEAMVLEADLLRRYGKVPNCLIEELNSISRAVKEVGVFSEDLQERANNLSRELDRPIYKEYFKQCVEKEMTELYDEGISDLSCQELTEPALEGHLETKENNYKVVSNTCNCHPETCCCDKWKVVNEESEKIATFYNKDDAKKLVELLKSG